MLGNLEKRVSAGLNVSNGALAKTPKVVLKFNPSPEISVTAETMLMNRVIAKMAYLILTIVLCVLGEICLCFLLMYPNKSWMNPNGQIHPQVALPKITAIKRNEAIESKGKIPS